jgi:hypothetical protein
VTESEQYKTYFSTPWGSYIYVRMPFGLNNVGVTFERAMDVAFSYFIDIFMAVYQDDLIELSRKEEEHCMQL